MRKADLSATATGRIKGMVELRTIVQELIDYQLNDYPEEAIAQKQRELNVAYDRFADQYGLCLLYTSGEYQDYDIPGEALTD